jgi:prepilin-type N-terminal cleavage/methylation domain-containing protein
LDIYKGAEQCALPCFFGREQLTKKKGKEVNAKKRRKRNGFSLIEILIVIVVLGIIAVVFTA